MTTSSFLKKMMYFCHAFFKVMSHVTFTQATLIMSPNYHMVL